jgi:glycosyltransferase involved in cell wall biosynthesis
MMFDRILYASLVDVSLPNGPGVNERGFLGELLARMGPGLHAVLPKPSRGMPGELAELGVTSIPCGRSVRSLGGWVRANLSGSSVVRRAAERFQPDLIVMRAGGLPLPQYVLARSGRAPYALKTAGDLTFTQFYGRSAWRKPFRPLNEAMWRRLLRGAICVDVVSESQREAGIRLHPDVADRIHVVDNGVDAEVFTPAKRSRARQELGFASDERVVGYVGTKPMTRGGREVIDVVAGMRGMHRMRGLIVGDSGDAADCRRYARDREVAEAVTVYGEADYADVPSLMAGLDVGLSIRRPEEQGQSELKVRQYLATGLCVVGTGISNDFLRGRDFARVVDDISEETIVGAVASRLGGGADGLATLGAKARAFAETSLTIRAQTDRRFALWRAAVEPPVTARSRPLT